MWVIQACVWMTEECGPAFYDTVNYGACWKGLSYWDKQNDLLRFCNFAFVEAVPSWVCCGLDLDIDFLPLQVRNLSEFPFPLTGHREPVLFSGRRRRGGGVAFSSWLQVPGNLSALYIPQYRSCDQSLARASRAWPERFTECLFSFPFYVFFDFYSQPGSGVWWHSVTVIGCTFIFAITLVNVFI